MTIQNKKSKSERNYYDVVIIGGGIAGLYSAYNIHKMSPTTSVVVLERYKQKWFGGRLGNEMFQGVEVVNGAGVGRKEKDYLLIELMKELKIHYSEFQVKPSYSPLIQPPCDVKKLISLLRREFKSKNEPKNLTFKEFATSVLGPQLYTNFLTCAGYTDYENEDAYDTLYQYGFEDNFAEWTALHIPWKKLVYRLAEKVGNVRISSKVTKITKNSDDHFLIQTEKGSEPGPNYECEKVIIATDVSCLLKILPADIPNRALYEQIHGQPFLRVYGRFSKDSLSILDKFVKSYTIVPGPLYKIIPMDRKKGVYMIAYTDNAGALVLKKYLENTEKNRHFFAYLVEKSLGLPQNTLHLLAIKDFYWPIGTHYYSPLDHTKFKNRREFVKELQHPEANMLVVGEMISMNQGWTQGALESVQMGLTKKWIQG